MSVYSDPALWEQAKAEARKRMGGHSARAMQLAGRLYRAAGGKYLGKRTKAQKSLEQWTDQDWTTKSGKPSRQTGERYLPRKVIEKLTPAEYGATTRAKRKGTAAGQQFVKQPARIAAKVARLKGNPTMKKPTPAQLAARARFAEMARSGAFKRKAKRNPAKKTVSEKISQLTREGYPQKQAVAIALSEERAGKVKRNPISQVAQTIYQQIGGGRFAAMTGAKNFVAGEDFLQFSIPRNQSGANKVRISYHYGSDFYTLAFIKVYKDGSYANVQVFENATADQLQPLFTQVTGMDTSLGTMGRKNNPRASNPARRGRAPSIEQDQRGKTMVYKRYTIIVPPFGEFAYIRRDNTNIGAARSVSEAKSLIDMLTDGLPNPATGTKKSRTKLNPMAAPVQVSSDSMFKYAVEAKRSLGSAGAVFETVAAFHTKAQAQDYAKAVLASHPSATLRIKTYSRQK